LEVIDLSARPVTAKPKRKQAALKLGLVKGPASGWLQGYRDFVERELFRYAPVSGGFEVLSRFWTCVRRLVNLRRKGYSRRDPERLFLNICPYFHGYRESDIAFDLPVGRFRLVDMISSGEILCPQNVYEDGWMREQVKLSFRAVSHGVLRLHGIHHFPNESQASVEVNGKLLKPITVKPGKFMLDIPVAVTGGMVTVSVQFSFEKQLDYPDERIVSVQLTDVEFEKAL
jgi:hypothetical protein